MAHGRPSLSRRSSFLQLHRLGGVRVTEYRATIPCDIHGDFEIFQIACVIAASACSIAVSTSNQIPQSSAGIGSSSHGSMTIANLIHPLVYARGANMPQDALDSLRIIDQ
ncbi:MAG: hypothetical protein FJ167_07095 [Gammaproteobacteria bacterium]|nr:hypothetical protein [Gammaproteobacteria bacterium]